MRYCYLLFAFLFLSLSLYAQTAADLTGRWEGQLDLPGRILKMNLTISDGPDGLAVAVDVPQQNIESDPATDVKLEDGRFSFSLPSVPGNAGWSGQFKKAAGENALDSLIGTWSQGAEISLNFARPSGPLAGPALAANLEKIETYAAGLLERMNVPGAGIAIVHNDRVVKSFGVGMADLEAGRPATGNTVFAIGSSSKAFTAFGLGLLVDEGKLEWDQPVIEYMPDFRMHDAFATREMTAIDLLTHRSGLPRHDLLWYFNQDLTREDLFQRLRYLEPTKSFRTTFQYQNLMYMAAGVLTERISGEKWEDFIRERIFLPLDMTSANFDISSFPTLPDHALGYFENEEEELEKIDFHPLPAIGPAGSINASAADMGKWVSLHLTGGKQGNKQLIESSTLQSLHQPRIPIQGSRNGVTHLQYALGWMTYDWNGNLIVEHGGNIDGFSALVYMAPEEDLGFVILTNKNGTGYGSFVARYALDVLMGKAADDYYTADQNEDDEEEEDDAEEEPDTASPFTDTRPHHDLDSYVGTYQDPGYGEIIVSRVGDSLRFVYGDLSGPLRHRHFETFRTAVEQPPIKIDFNFTTGANGKVNGMEVDVEASLGHPVKFEKQGDERMKDPDYLDQLAGDYELNGQILVIKRVRDHLTLDVPGQPTYELEADSDNEFKLTVASGYSVEFHFDGDKVIALELHQPNGNFRAERQE